jgi:hypothetical protein
MAPEPSRAVLSAEQAFALLTTTLREGLRSPGALAIKATAGLGKSKAAASELVLIPNICALHVDVYVPSRKEQRQWQATLTAAANQANVPINVLLIEGRNEENCVQHEAASLLSKAGLSPTKLLCRAADKECRAYQGCPYREQFVSKGPAIRIFTHSHLATPIPDGFRRADIVMIDESFHAVAVQVDKDIPVDDIRLLRGIDAARLPLGAYTGKPLVENSMTLGEVFTICRSVAEAVSSTLPLLDGLRGRGLSSEKLNEVAALILGSLKYPRIAPNDTFPRINSELRRCERSRATSIALMFQTLARELETQRSESHSIKRIDAHTFTLCTRKKLPRLCDVETIIILDADSDENNLRPIIPQIRTVSIEARMRARITQVQDLSFSRQYLRLRDGEQPKAEAVVALADRVRSWAGRRKLVVTYQALIPHLAPLLPNVEFCYFGNLRGTNDYEGCDTVFVIGRQFIPSTAVEEIARALHWDAEEPLILGDPIPRRHLAGPGVLKSYDELDPRLQSVRAASREAETRQALARVRLVHAQELKEVVLLSSQPVGVPVDALVTFEPPKGERIFERLGGVLPFAAEDLVRLGVSEFRDTRAALRWRSRPETTPAAIRDSLKRAGVVVAETFYRRAGQRGPQSRLLVDYLRHPMPHITVPRLLAAPGQGATEVAPLDWVCEPMEGIPGIEVCRLRKPMDKEQAA